MVCDSPGKSYLGPCSCKVWHLTRLIDILLFYAPIFFIVLCKQKRGMGNLSLTSQNISRGFRCQDHRVPHITALCLSFCSCTTTLTQQGSNARLCDREAHIWIIWTTLCLCTIYLLLINFWDVHIIQADTLIINAQYEICNCRFLVSLPGSKRILFSI